MFSLCGWLIQGELLTFLGQDGEALLGTLKDQLIAATLDVVETVSGSYP
jgi:hypothetical protein